MESRLRQSAFSRMVLATASALSMVLTAAQVKDSSRAASSCVCRSSTAYQLQTYMLSCTMSPELSRALVSGKHISEHSQLCPANEPVEAQHLHSEALPKRHGQASGLTRMSMLDSALFTAMCKFSRCVK